MTGIDKELEKRSKKCEIDGTCDGCNRNTIVKRLKLKGGAGVFLCKDCWIKQMEWKKLRNLKLSDDAKFDIIKWEEYDCKNYEQ